MNSLGRTHSSTATDRDLKTNTFSSLTVHSFSLLSSLYPMHLSTFCLSLSWSPSWDVLSQLPTFQRTWRKNQSFLFTNQCTCDCLKNNIKIYIKIAPTCFGAVTPSSGIALFVLINFWHRASCILGQAFHYSPENAFFIYLINKYISLSDICLTMHHWYK